MNVKNITTCPTSPEVFRKRGIELGCTVGKEYHCMMNEKKRHVELCISRSWIQPDHCPEYNTAANRIDVSACDASDGVCPPAIYWSNTSFQYSGCLPEQGTTDTSNPEKDSNDILVISVVVSLMSLVIICIVCAVLFVRCRRKRQRSKTEEVPLFTEENNLIWLEEEMKKGGEIIDEHRADNTYTPIHAVKKGKSILDEKKILVIQGITGSGKTKTALQIASEWKREDEFIRKCVYLKSLDDLQSVTFYDKTCIILDGCFTRWALDSSSTDVSKDSLRLHEQIKKHNFIYLIITVHKYIFSQHRSMLQKYDLFSNEHLLTLEYEDDEKKKILTYYLTHTEGSTCDTVAEKELKKLLSNCTKNVGFPSVCWMYTNIPVYEKEGNAFFRGCEFVLQKYIGKMKNSLKCCLFYAMLRSKNCEFDTNDIDDDCLNVLKEEYSCNDMTDEQLLEYFGKDNPYFTSRGNHVFSFSQTAIYEACLKIWFRKKRELFLRLCNLEQVKENIRNETYKVESGTCILALKMEEFSLFAPKFSNIMGEQKELEYHPLLQNQRFCRIVNEEPLENKSQPVWQKEIPDVHIESESRPLLPKQQEDQPERKQEDQPEQKQEEQSEQQQQQPEQQPEQQQQQQKQSLTQGENMELDFRSATSNEKLWKEFDEKDRQQNSNATDAQEEKENISKTKKLQQPQRKPQKDLRITTKVTKRTSDLNDETNEQPEDIKDDHF